MANSGYKNISRVDDDDHQLHGYLVRVPWLKKKWKREARA